MATSETRMGSTCPTNEKGIKRKVVVRSVGLRGRESETGIERERESIRLHRRSRRSSGEISAMRGTIDGRRGKCSREVRRRRRGDRSRSGGRKWLESKSNGRAKGERRRRSRPSSPRRGETRSFRNRARERYSPPSPCILYSAATCGRRKAII